MIATATDIVAAADAVENENEPNDIASAHTAEVCAAHAVQKKQKPDDVTSAASATIASAVCKEIHYVTS